jgi:endonuclease/exonuclease/phosphatase family metal-dependent hydrolase
MRVLSWNLLRRRGAGVEDICRLVEAHRPDLVLLQEATAGIDTLPDALGGHYARREMEGRGHGLAAWSLRPFTAGTVALPPAARLDIPVPVRRCLTRRIALIVRLDGIEIANLQIANVHLDHGQFANRRQLRHVLDQCPQLDAVIGDYNAMGATTLPGFADVGPRHATHRAKGIVPLRLDRCLARGLRGEGAVALAYGASDHRPILVDLMPDGGRSLG